MTLSPTTFDEAKARANRYEQNRREKALKSPRGYKGSQKPLRRSLKPSSRVKPLSQRPAKRLRTKPRKGREKMPSFKWLKNRLDVLTSQIVRLRDGRCVLCGLTERLQCGHIFGRRSHGVRWDVETDGNCHGQCAGCNQRHNYEPLRFYRWFIANHGQEKFDQLYSRWQAGRKYTRLELVNLITEYETKLKEMSNGDV